MRFDERYLEELKGRVRLSDVIGRSVKLRRQGREYVGLSPFAKEKTPSFFVNDEKGFFHDFSSGKHGDLIGFLVEHDRLSFREAVEKLAGEAGMALPAEDPRQAEVESRRLGLQEWLEEAAKWFEAQLRRPPGQAARAYLDRRGLPVEEHARFRLGFAPAGRTGLKDHLVAKGAKPADLVDAGLLIAPEDGSAPYDRFRDRIIFPIADGRGRIVSFGGRAMDPEARAKYLNGPETSLFHKSRVLYGLHEARRLLHAGESAGDGTGLVVVEGYMDVIACQRAGVAAVAAMGTALTEEQMEALWRLHPEPTLSFDGDAAGRRAAWRTLDRALPLLQPGRSFRFCAPEGGKDPDEVLREAGAAVLKAELNRTQPFVAELFAREQAAEPLATPESYAGLKVRLRKLAGAIADRDLAGMYRETLLDRFEELRTLARPAATLSGAGRALAQERWKGRRKVDLVSRAGASPEGLAGARAAREAPRPFAAAVAQGLMERPELIDDHIEALSVQGFCEPRLDGLAREMVALRVHGQALDARGLQAHLAEHGHQKDMRAIARAAERSGAPFLRAEVGMEEARALWSHAYERLIQASALDRAFADAKADLERDPDIPTLMRLKSDRDAQWRAIQTGMVWEDAAQPVG